MTDCAAQHAGAKHHCPSDYSWPGDWGAQCNKLAQEFGYSHYIAASGQYGVLAHQIADALHHKPGPFPDGKTHWWHTLAYGNNGEPFEAEYYAWIMRPELVQALQEMRWA